nr:hypothetical protein [Tanacetum cinerariifolium]
MLPSCQEIVLEFGFLINGVSMREVHRVKVFDFGGLSGLMAEGLSARMLMEHRDAQGQETDPRQGGSKGLLDRISSARDFLGIALSYIAIWDSILRLCHRLIACSIARRSQAHEKGLTVISLELSIIDMAELVRLEICMKVDDTWAWVAVRLKRHPDAEGGAPRVAQDAPAIDEGVQAVSTPMQGINTKEMNGVRDDFKCVEAKEKSHLKTSL